MKNQFIATIIAIFISTVAFSQATQVTTIQLVETPGQFETKELKLKAGSYQFEVSNKGIDHEVAFFLQHEKDKGNTDFGTAIPNSGLPKTIKDKESAKTGVVELKKGTYVYSCPLNPTPHYKITVE